jgi:hypothetical protein
MSENQTQSLNRLLKKLSAVRATLKKDERMLLDDMVMNARIEVQQHGLQAGASARPITGASAGASAAATQVAQHGLESKPAEKPAERPQEVALHGLESKPAEKPAERPQEVALHGMEAKPMERPAANRPVFEIGLDEKMDSYKIF